MIFSHSVIFCGAEVLGHSLVGRCGCSWFRDPHTLLLLNHVPRKVSLAGWQARGVRDGPLKMVSVCLAGLLRTAPECGSGCFLQPGLSVASIPPPARPLLPQQPFPEPAMSFAPGLPPPSAPVPTGPGQPTPPAHQVSAGCPSLWVPWVPGSPQALPVRIGWPEPPGRSRPPIRLLCSSPGPRV